MRSPYERRRPPVWDGTDDDRDRWWDARFDPTGRAAVADVMDKRRRRTADPPPSPPQPQINAPLPKTVGALHFSEGEDQ
jgi:hypothetical protein